MRSGVIKPGRGKLPAALKHAPEGRPPGGSVVDALLEERRADDSDR